MTETERNQIKGALLKCAEENENKPILTGYIVVSSLCKSAVERIEELEKENAELKLYAKSLEETANTNILHCTKVNGQLYKAKGIIRSIIDDWTTTEGEQVRELKSVKEAEQFLNKL